MEKEQLKPILEAVLMAASSPLSADALLNIFEENQRPERDELKAALEELGNECEARSYELKQVSSGYRFQVKKDYADFVSRLWEEKPARYSRALLETMALIAYRQPITRGEIEAVRGVSVSSHIIKTLDERNWIKVVGHRDVPGKPALYATTKEFLDYFNLASLDELPSLQDIRDIDQINAELDLRMPQSAEGGPESTAEGKTPVAADEQAVEDQETVISLETADEADEASGDDTSSPASSAEQQDSVIGLDAADESDEDTSDSPSSQADDADNSDEHRNAAPASAEH